MKDSQWVSPRPVNIEQAAREYRKRNVIFFTTFIGGFFVAAIFGTLVSHFFGKAGGLIGVLWTIAFAVTGIWRLRWPCPRCSNKFFFKWPRGNGFAMKCVHCGFDPRQTA